MIIDSHTHLIPPDVIKNWSHYANRDATFAELFHRSSKTSTAEQLLEAMNNHGIAKSVVLGMGWTDNSLNEYVNDYLLESFHKYPDKIVPVTGIAPSSGNQGIYEAERCLSAGSRGFGEIHAYSQNYNLIDLVKYSITQQFFKFLHKCFPSNHAIDLANFQASIH